MQAAPHWEQITAHTRALAAAAQASDWAAFETALAERGRALAAFAAAGATAPTPEQRRDLEKAGEQARWILAARRENLRTELGDVRVSRRNARALQPFEPEIGRRLDREA